MSETYGNVANIDDIARRWPDGREVPQLLRDVVAYVHEQPWMSLGATRLLGDRMDDYWIENGADLWRDFGIFMRLPDGSRVAQWFRDDNPGEPPIVLIGSEGELKVLAQDLKSFLAAWALAGYDDRGALIARSAIAAIPVELPSDLVRTDDEDEDDVPDGRPKFATFLERGLGSPLVKHLKPKPSDAPLLQFFQTWGEQARKAFAENSHLKAIASALAPYAPRGKPSWQRESFALAIIGDRIEIGGMGDPRKPLDDEVAKVLRPLIAAEREARAQGVHGPRGLWHSASILLYSDGSCHIAADWEAQPKFWRGPAPSAAEFASDQRRFPRSERWLQPWMSTLN